MAEQEQQQQLENQEKEQVTTETEVTLNPEEEAASQSGWVPKDQWKGDPEEWRPAKEFNERGELFNRIKAQSKELQNLKRAMQFLTSQQQTQFQAGFQAGLEKLKLERKEAIEQGDLDKVVTITDKIDEMKEKRQAQVQQQVPQFNAEPSPVFKDWASKNDWYGKDKVLTKFADSLGLSFKEENPELEGSHGEEEMLKHVSKTIKKEFPHKFQKNYPPTPDGEGRQATDRGRTGSSKMSEIKSQMSEQELKIMKTILQTTKGLSEEDYLKQYAGR